VIRKGDFLAKPLPADHHETHQTLTHGVLNGLYPESGLVKTYVHAQHLSPTWKEISGYLICRNWGEEEEVEVNNTL
jgi:hypothetical protein